MANRKCRFVERMGDIYLYEVTVFPYQNYSNADTHIAKDLSDFSNFVDVDLASKTYYSPEAL